ncbi:5-methylcytosine restriction system specificity protein McrC [Solibacillus sp. FSL K6-1523]|uniref:5-methylcytosine restriction system specificity protein McrC n=1 Tax=Solibacillus sp. FSL K6-1523 TaxID=2921471 RepID=UPI0030FA09BC
MAPIPIQNIYYMLCYSAGLLPEKDERAVSAIDNTELLEMFAQTFLHKVKSLVKKGFYKEYLIMQEARSTPKGKILFKESIAQQTFLKAQLACQFDEFTVNILPNQLLKATIHQLIKHPSVKKDTKDQLKKLYPYFHEIELINLKPQYFDQILLHRNNRHYKILLSMCKLIYFSNLIDENEGVFDFIHFDQTNKMNELFEQFVREFYKLEQPEYRVYRETMQWKVGAIHTGDASLIPKMQTDICLVNNFKKIIIDTKYYKQALKMNFQMEPKVNSENLYQLFSYLSNAEPREYMEGILLYPETDQYVNLAFEMNGFTMKVCTINLNQDWKKIKKDLLALIQ